VLALIAALVAGVVEEVIFRGYVMTTLARMGYRNLVQVLVSGTAFAIADVYRFAPPATFLATQGFTLVLGIALGMVYVIGKRSLTPVIVSHALIDAMIEPWLLLSFFRF
jgi:membrane protease YdiL (CAAX protease family)